MKKQNTWMYILGGLAVVAVIGLAIFSQGEQFQGMLKLPAKRAVSPVATPPLAAKPVITKLFVNPTTFSPNGDGIDDKTTIGLDISMNATVTIPVLDASGNEVIKLWTNQAMGGPGGIGFTWDGKDANGNIVANGTYTIKVTASNAGGTDEKSVSVTVRNPVRAR